MAVLQKPGLASAFVGRSAELAALEQLLDGLDAGHGAFALVGGDAGIGKTRLCREVKLAAGRRGIRVMEGRAAPAEASAPYGPFMDLLRFRIARGEGDAVADVLAPVLAHVGPLLSGLESRRTGQPVATSVPFEPIWRVLQRLAAAGPTLLVLEDVHWADQTTLDLLLFLARRMPTVPLVLLATYRTDEVAPGHSVQRLAAALAREPAAVRVQLEPFTADEVSALLESVLDRTPDPALVDAVQRRAEGNPFYVEELVGVLLATSLQSDISADAVARLAAPATLHDVVWERLGLLGEDAREALVVAAVAGRRFRFDVLARVLEWPEERLLPAVESLVAAHLLNEVTAGADEVYEFHHSLVQEVLYGTVIGRRRRVWHRRVAEALEGPDMATSLPHATLAHHYRQAGDLVRARDHAIRAADEAARLCAWKDAEVLYEAALSALEHTDGDAALQARLLERMADVAWWQNRLPAMDQYLEEALGLRRRLGDRHGAARLLRRRALLDADQRGAEEKALAGLEAALALVDDASSERALVASDLGRLRMRRGEFDLANSLFEEALAVSSSHGDCGEDAFALAMLGLLAVQRGEIRAGTERLELARSLITDEPHSMERAAAIYHAGIRAFDACRDHRRAAEWVDAALSHAEAHHVAAHRALCRARQASVARRAGAWDEAIEVATHAVAELRAAGRAELREALRIVGDLERSRGRLDAAAAAYEEAARLGDADGAVGLALLRVAERDWARAAAELEQELARRPAADRLFRLRVLPILIETLAEAGAAERTAEVVASLQHELAGSDYAPGPAVLAQAEAWLLAVRGDAAGAVAAQSRALAAWHALELPYETARATLLLGERLIACGRVDEGVAAVTDAGHAFEALGASLELARAHCALRTAGVRVRRRRTSRRPRLDPPLDRLTPRELDVLAELARGSTNKRIARTLSMSPRTVGNHVSSILAKVGCATRTEASRLALEARLDRVSAAGPSAAVPA